jgi:pyroglutamyl-peptidase
MGPKAVLVTGFEPYGGGRINPSALVVRTLDGAEVGSARVVGRTLPVAFRGLRQHAEALVRELDPAVIVSLGLWPGEPTIRLERLAVNVADCEIPDNEGAFLEDAPLAPGTAAIPSRLPLRAIERALLEAGIPARVSNTAGTFLCNATMYTFLEATAGAQPPVACGFVHLPYLPEQVAELLRTTKAERRLEVHQRADLASMSLDRMVEAVRIALATSLAAARPARP